MPTEHGFSVITGCYTTPEGLKLVPMEQKKVLLFTYKAQIYIVQKWI